MSTTTPDPFGGLEGEDRDAYLAIVNTLKTYGLESLAADVLAFIQQGYSEDTINILLQETKAYKQRFVANEARRKAGLQVLSPGEYLAVERAYRQVMTASGLPAGFYDTPDDFTKWIEADVSAQEVQERVGIAESMVNSIDPNTRQTWEQWYSHGDMVAYALDRTRATAVIDRQWKAAQIGGTATSQGMSIDSSLAERIADNGVNAAQARQGFGLARQISDTASKLSAIYGGSYTEDDATREVFLSDEQAARKRRGLASQERAQFSGTRGVSSKSLSSRSAGRI